MYGSSVGTASTATGVAVLPNTGDNNLLFAVALGLLVTGVIVLIASAFASRKRNHSNVN